jgi:hypothetical protein
MPTTAGEAAAWQLQGCCVDDEDVAALCRRLGTDRPSTISLGANRIGCRGCKLLAQALLTAGNQGVTSLSLVSNRIGNAGAVALARTLRSPGCGIAAVYLGHNRIGAAGARALARAAKEHRALVTLSLDGNPIYDAEPLRQIAGWLERNNTEATARAMGNTATPELLGLPGRELRGRHQPIWDLSAGCYVHVRTRQQRPRRPRQQLEGTTGAAGSTKPPNRLLVDEEAAAATAAAAAHRRARARQARPTFGRAQRPAAPHEQIPAGPPPGCTSRRGVRAPPSELARALVALHGAAALAERLLEPAHPSADDLCPRGHDRGPVVLNSKLVSVQEPWSRSLRAGRQK